MQKWKNTIRRICVALLAATALLVFPPIAQANTPTSVDVYYYEFDSSNRAYFVTERFEVHGRLAGDEQALLYVRFANLLENAAPNKIPAVAKGTRLLGVWLNHDTLFINLSREALSYGGGAAGEHLLIDQLLRNAAAVPNVACLTLLVEGQDIIWPEGSLTSWIPIPIWAAQSFFY